MSKLITSIESLQLLLSLERHSSKLSLNKEAALYGNVAIETICSMNNIENNCSLESMVTVSMEPVINTLFDKISKESAELLLDTLKRINNKKLGMLHIENDIISLLDKITYLEKTDVMPLMNNLQPFDGCSYLYNSNGFDLDNVINTISILQNEYITKVDNITLNTIRYIYSELNNPSDRLIKNYNLNILDMPTEVNDNLSGFINFIFNKDSSSEIITVENDVALNTLRNTSVQLTYVNNDDLSIELNTQCNMSTSEWIDFNSKPRKEADKSIMPVMTVAQCEQIIESMKKINDVIHTRNDQMLMTAFASSEFTDVVNRLIHLAKEDFGAKESFLYELFVSVIDLYKETDDKIMKLIIRYEEILIKYLNKTLAFYSYK